MRAHVCAVALALLLIAAPAATGAVQLTAVQRVPFPTRQYVVDLGRDTAVTPKAVHLFENGAPVRDFTLRPLSSSSVRGSVVLAIDASNSMAGAPFAAAVKAARTFAGTRAGTERIGVVTFNGSVQVVQAPVSSAHAVETSLEQLPPLANGTHIYDAVVASVGLLRQSNSATRTIVLLSDGADVGSSETLASAIAMARRDHIRVFTIGLASKAYDPAPLRALAGETGAAYFEAASAVELESIYKALGNRLANQYLLTYRSDAIPTSSVTLRLDIRGIGSQAVDYIAPKPQAVAPFHRSPFRRFVGSPFATLVVSLLVALLSIAVIALLVRRPKSGITGRIEQFLSGRRPVETLRVSSKVLEDSIFRSPRAQHWLRRLERDLDIADVDMTATRLVGVTVAATVMVSLFFAAVFPVVMILSLMMIPLTSRAWVRRKVRQVRADFADQLPPNLQVLASAMRAGHSLSGALAVAVENAHEPSRRELRRAVHDDKLGIPVDEALRRVADRMENRDLQQVALLSELQRTAGGNAAEVLDTVVETIRERSDVRRLVQTLTAQGRMARWVLSAMPPIVAALLWLMQPGIMTPFFSSAAGQFALVVAALMTIAGSFVIQRIVEIEV
jgi:tight adherence protein B